MKAKVDNLNRKENVPMVFPSLHVCTMEHKTYSTERRFLVFWSIFLEYVRTVAARRVLSFISVNTFLFRNGLIYFPDFCQVVLKRYRQDKDAEENFMQNMFKVKKNFLRDCLFKKLIKFKCFRWCAAQNLYRQTSRPKSTNWKNTSSWR